MAKRLDGYGRKDGDLLMHLVGQEFVWSATGEKFTLQRINWNGKKWWTTMESASGKPYPNELSRLLEEISDQIDWSVVFPEEDDSLESRVARLEQILAQGEVFADTVRIPRVVHWHQILENHEKLITQQSWMDGLSKRARGILVKNGFSCLADLKKFVKSGAPLGNLKNMGPTSQKEILDHFNLKVKK